MDLKHSFWFACIILLVAAIACTNVDENNNDTSYKIKYPKGQGYGMITDSTFYYFTKYTDGSVDTTYYKCETDKMKQAMDKIFYSHIYASLNWMAQKEYHEKLVKIKTIQYWPHEGN